MPAIITHDLFGRELYDELSSFIGTSRDEVEAFLLGNQGPDPLFYAIIDPRYINFNHLGSRLHKEKPHEVIASFKHAISTLPESSRNIARAYALGFLCHYELDSREHAFIYSQQYEICDAGEPRLTRANGHDVHAAIETELDELTLTAKRHETISTFVPSREILKADNDVLDIISAMYAYVFDNVFHRHVAKHGFKGSVKAYRHMQSFFYSPRGIKRNVVGYVEMLVRPYSFLRAMCHRNQLLNVSEFDNHEHMPWKNTFTGEVTTDSFWDLYDESKSHALSELPIFDEPTFDIKDAQEITRGINFTGKPVMNFPQQNLLTV